MRSLFLLIFILFPTKTISNRQFAIDYENDRFVKDGEPFQYISGSIHYFRVQPQAWKDRLLRMKAAGLNAIQTYIAWNIHEPFPGQFDFKGIANISKFLDLAQELGFVVILRPGPYIDASWDNGGLPWWLLKMPDIAPRTSDPRFLRFVSVWFKELFKHLRPYLYSNGGPIVMVQVENEYGSFHAPDEHYATFLRDLLRGLVGNDTVLFTVDGGALHYLKGGTIPEVYPTVDFGTWNLNISKAFAAQRKYAPKGPYVNSEFYPGIDVRWGQTYPAWIKTSKILKIMEEMYRDYNASFNLYMFEGGTNFGYMAAGDRPYPITTTYDFAGPLSGGGEMTDRYYQIREKIGNLTWKKLPKVPQVIPKVGYGDVLLVNLGPIIDPGLLNILAPKSARVQTKYPVSVEQFDFPYGFALYETEIPKSFGLLPKKGNLSGSGVKDRGYVMVKKELQGVFIYELGHTITHSVDILAQAGDKLQILVENQGRDCMPNAPNDPKGIVSNITLNGEILTDWTIYPLSLENIFKEIPNIRSMKPKSFLPSVYFGSFPANASADTYFNPDGWGKGQMFLNGKNVGRYWPSLGPQVTLYVPGTWVRPLNEVLLLELESPANCPGKDKKFCRVTFVDKPYLNKTVVPP